MSGTNASIYEAAVIDADYGYKGEEKEGAMLLEAGLHPFRLYYSGRKDGEKLLDIAWSGPGIIKQPIPGEVFRTL